MQKKYVLRSSMGYLMPKQSNNEYKDWSTNTKKVINPIQWSEDIFKAELFRNKRKAVQRMWDIKSGNIFEITLVEVNYKKKGEK